MQKADKLRVILDTNLLISAIIIPQSIPDKIIQAWKDNLFILLISQLQIDELEDVTSRKKFQSHYLLFNERSNELIISLKASAELVEPLPDKDLPIQSRDPEDNFLLAAGLGAAADYLVTGDQDLLILYGDPALGKLKIIQVDKFLSVIR